jgi:hypothetical protein
VPLCATGLAARPRTPRLVSTSNHTKPELERMVHVTLVPEMHWTIAGESSGGGLGWPQTGRAEWLQVTSSPPVHLLSE